MEPKVLHAKIKLDNEDAVSRLADDLKELKWYRQICPTAAELEALLVEKDSQIVELTKDKDNWLSKHSILLQQLAQIKEENNKKVALETLYKLAADIMVKYHSHETYSHKNSTDVFDLRSDQALVSVVLSEFLLACKRECKK